MSTIADLVIKVRADTGAADKDITSFGSKVGSGFKKALIPATGALLAMGVVGKAAFANLQDGAKNAAQTEQVIKTTGGAANVTAKHVDELSMSLRRQAGVDDDLVHVGANMLLTFTNVRNEVGKGNDIFDRATATVLDMSTALGQDTKSSAIQLGKALNDPIKGVTALQRVGVSFTDAQKQQIKSMVESGNVMGAQKLILGELNKEFGGASTHIDPMQRSIANLKLDVIDFASSLVSAAMPALKMLIGVLGGATSFMQEHAGATKVVLGVLLGLIATVFAVNAAMAVYAAGAAVVRAATVAWTGVQWLLNAALTANPIGIVIVALALLGAALVIAWTKSETFRRSVTTAWNAIKSVTMTVFNFIRDHIRLVMAALLVIMTGGLAAVVLLVIAKWGAIRGATSGAWEGIKGVVTGAVNAIKSVVSSVFGALGGIVSRAAGVVRSAVSGIVSTFQRIVDVLRDIVSAAQSAFSMIGKVTGAAGKIGGAIGKIGGLIPGHAKGTSYSRGGLAVVGEQGPELVNLNRGSSVFSNSDTRSMLGQGGGPLIGEVHVHDNADIELLARRVQRVLAFD